MKDATNRTDMDGLRLIGLGHVPACAECPRYRDIVAAYEQPDLRGAPLAAVPRECSHAYCAPLARRYGARPMIRRSDSRVANLTRGRPDASPASRSAESIRCQSSVLTG